MTSNVKINNGTNFNQKYKPYIFNGTTWVPSQAIVTESNYEIKTLSGRYINFTDGELNGQITQCKVIFPAIDGVTYNNIKIYQQAKNLFPSTFPIHKISASVGSSGVASASNARTFTVPCKPTTNYYFSQSPRTSWAVGFTNSEIPVIGSTELTFKGNMNNRDGVCWASGDNNFIIMSIVNETAFNNQQSYSIMITEGNNLQTYEIPTYNCYIRTFDPITSGELDLLTGKLIDQNNNIIYLDPLSICTLEGINNISLNDINTTLTLSYMTHPNN